MRMSLGKVILFWVVSVGLLVFSCYFSFMLGRDQGFNAALELYDEQVVRLPVPPPEQDETVSLSTPDIAEVLESEKPIEIASLPNTDDVPEPEIDFGAEAELPPLPNDDIVEADLNVGSTVPPKLPASESKPEASPSSLAARSVADMTDAEKLDALLNDPAVVSPEQDPAPDTTRSIRIGSTPKVESSPLVPPVRSIGARKDTAPSRLSRDVSPPKQTLPQVASQSARSIEELTPAGETSDNITDNPRQGWYLQVAAARTASEAQFLYRKVVALDMPCTIQSAVINKTQYYRVLVGPFASRDVARARSADVKRNGISRGEPFVKRIAGG